MEKTFNGRRSSVLSTLQGSRAEIADLNADIEYRIALHKEEIAQLKARQKQLKRTKVKGGWLLSLLIRWLK